MRALFPLTLGFVLTGCATLSPVIPQSESPGEAVVVLKQRDRDLFKLEVYNTSNAPMVVDRDAITLHSPAGVEKRRPGGFTNTYVIEPGGRHAVNVKFAMHGLEHGDAVQIDFHDAMTVAGRSVDICPLELRVD